jgi:hypothetical protein
MIRGAAVGADAAHRRSHRVPGPCPLGG